VSSQANLAANRKNAALSTGPSSPEGKAIASRNSLKHGLLASDAVLPEEDTQAFLELLANLQAEHQPVGPLEELLLHHLATAQWRLARLIRIETGLLACRLDDTRADQEDHDDDYQDDDDQDHDEPAPNHDQPPEDPERAKRRAYDQTTRLLGLSFGNDTSGPESLSKLSRYENTLRRAFYKALWTLRFAQARRMGQPPPRMPR